MKYGEYVCTNLITSAILIFIFPYVTGFLVDVYPSLLPLVESYRGGAIALLIMSVVPAYPILAGLLTAAICGIFFSAPWYATLVQLIIFFGIGLRFDLASRMCR